MVGRKFIGMVVGIIILVGILIFIGINAPLAITGTVLIVYGILIVTLIMSYIGGNVWNNWIKSKYFVPELAGLSPNNNEKTSSPLPLQENVEVVGK